MHLKVYIYNIATDFAVKIQTFLQMIIFQKIVKLRGDLQCKQTFTNFLPNVFSNGFFFLSSKTCWDTR